MPLPANKTVRAIPAPVVTVLAACLLLTGLFARGAEEGDDQLENKEVELESIRSEIRDVQSRINAAQSDSEAYLKDIQEAEKAAAETSAHLREIEADIKSKTARLEQLEKDKVHWEANLKSQRRNLARQIRIAYQTGHHDFVKLLLNQEDPARVGRMVTYHEYHNRARAEKIGAVKESLQKINTLQTTIKNETDELKDLRSSQMAKLEEHRQYRQSRQKAIDELQSYIDEQDTQLQHLQKNEKELADLLKRLKSEQLAVETYEELPPFQSLKGKLAWPVDGRFLNRYGDTRKGGKLRIYGVRIAADNGEDVHAISAGKVIFADWFRNMGLLMIIDHGDGFMSLYGNNERLLKKPGDIVGTGEVVAKVGDTGGQSETGLYFEIRRQGNPLNPSLWCQR